MKKHYILTAIALIALTACTDSRHPRRLGSSDRAMIIEARDMAIEAKKESEQALNEARRANAKAKQASSKAKTASEEADRAFRRIQEK